MIRPLLALTLLAGALPGAAVAQTAPSVQRQVETELAKASPGTRFGLVVTDAAGRELVAVNPEQRFMPASNTKIVTTAAAFAALPAIDRPDTTGGAQVRMEGRDVVLVGRGDARLSSAPDCQTDCLATLADAIAVRTKRVRNVIGDATLFPDERWSSGMSWNNIPYRYGTAISALTLDDNEMTLTVAPAASGRAPVVSHDGYVVVDNRAMTASGAATDIGHDRLPLERTVRLTGTIDAAAAARTLRIAVDDPAHRAAWMLARMLRERGVKVGGRVESRYRPPLIPPSPAPVAAPLASLTPPPLRDDLRTINKDSQNLHAELLIRRVGLIDGEGGVADGQKRVEAMFATAGVPRTAFDFSDGSGMSTYNRVAPRGMVTLLNWIAAQPWGAGFRDTLPVGGVDGTLARRFKGTELEGRIFAKTGSLNATSALAGYLIARSGRVLTFALYANDVPSGSSATPVMDAALLAVARAS